MGDEHATAIDERCRWARDHNEGHPSSAWTTGDQLAVALVLRDKDHMTALGYTTEQAADRVCDEAKLSAYELTGWLNDIRSALERDRQG